MSMYIAIDLKSFYASVECVERKLDPLTTNLIVADPTRSDNTICLAVSPSLKFFGVPGRPRLFEVKQVVSRVNRQRLQQNPNRKFFGRTSVASVLHDSFEYELDYIVAPPRMALYIDYSSRIYNVYLKYVAAEDIHVYSIDEVFINAEPYLKLYGLTPHELAIKMIRDVLATTGITATAGIGPNMFLCKVAMDIVAKHIPADRDGVRIAELDEISYRKQLWDHKPLTDFWRVGPGTMKRLAKYGIHTMGDIARCSLGKSNDFLNENLLFREFGKNAELLIDHAWGIEPCTIKAVKAYRPRSTSVSNGQVLPRPYGFVETRIIIREMAEILSLDLVKRGLRARQFNLYIGYDTVNNFDDVDLCVDWFGRMMPAPDHGLVNLAEYTSSTIEICNCLVRLFEEIANQDLNVRRINICAGDVLSEEQCTRVDRSWTPSLFDLDQTERKERAMSRNRKKREFALQNVVLDLKNRYGKNSVIHGVSLEEGATGRERNAQIGGHKA